MPPQPQEPQDHLENKDVAGATGAEPQPPKAPSPETNTDLSKILLPKKEVHSPASAQRVNAGVLLQQEQNATLVPEKEETPGPATPAPAAPKKAPEIVRPLQTYQGDIEQLVEQKNVSVVNIAAAEAARRNTPAPEPAPAELTPPKGSWVQKTLMIVVGIVLLAGAGGALAYVLFFSETPTTQITHDPQAPFIFVDNTDVTLLPAGELSQQAVMNSLQTARQNTKLSLGLMSRIYPATAPATPNAAPQLVNLQTILSTIAPEIPAELVRSIDPFYYTLGVHAFDENQAFLIFKVDSYSTAFAGMLEWERTMYDDLMPLFNRTPRPRIIGEEVATTTPPVQVLETTFADRVVENRDSRVVQNQAGDILLLWTFLDRSTIVITTNNHTLLEIITRFADLSITPGL